MTRPIPTNITADRTSQQLTITWNDGHTSDYPFGLLRKICPCAECRGDQTDSAIEPDFDGLVIPLIDARATMIRSIKPVGSYAINIEWEDGHQFGIYNWQYLRAWCPCTDCQSEGKN